jgi:hypothetical protein
VLVSFFFSWSVPSSTSPFGPSSFTLSSAPESATIDAQTCDRPVWV